jgi:glutamine---fructose-6-phosphate transaminase (isomerizing)
MCGIVGANSAGNIVPHLINGLKRLEYRGYDSAGIAVLQDASIRRVRRVGRVAEMESAVATEGVASGLGIGHTRWATHGGVTEPNAHPHVSHDDIAVVHNGIIENHEEKRDFLARMGYTFTSQTDTEVIAHLIHHHRKTAPSLFAATQQAVRELVGAYAIAVMSEREPDAMTCARVGCPLLIGVGDGENYVASDVSAIIDRTKRIIYLDEGDVAEIRRDRITIHDRQGNAVERAVHVSDASLASWSLGPYQHYMQKEIHEQPKALADTLEQALNEGVSPALFGADAAEVFGAIDRVLILAAGTSHYAGLVARQWLEGIARIPTQVELAHEYRYRDSLPDPRQLIITISQSGETLDTMEGLKRAKELGHSATLSICNVPQSAIPRASRLVYLTRAGAEIGVASTKAFTTQLAALFADSDPCAAPGHSQRGSDRKISRSAALCPG